MNNKHFNRRILAVALPMMIQNGITNFVQMLDNVMVGQVGTIPMSGVAIVNQLMFVFNLCVFGAASGAGIFTAQFKGREDQEGIRYTFRFKLMVGLLLGAMGIGIFLTFGRELIGLYLAGEGTPEDTAATMAYGMKYLKVMLLGLVPFALGNAYSSTMREVGETTVPMVAGIIAVLVNLAGNYILIFGKFGAPALGVNGAAIATVISRFVELAVIVVWAHRFPFMHGVYRTLYVPRKRIAQLFINGLPLMVNETLWASGVALVNQCYSMRGLDAVAAGNISQTFWNVFAIAYMAVGNAIGIILGWFGGDYPAAVGVMDWIGLVLICLVLPAVLSLLFSELLYRIGWIKAGDLTLKG